MALAEKLTHENAGASISRGVIVSMINDIILALNNQVVNQAKLQRLLDCASDTHVTLTLIRDGQIVNVALRVLQARQDRAYFTIENEEKFQQWLDH